MALASPRRPSPGEARPRASEQSSGDWLAPGRALLGNASATYYCWAPNTDPAAGIHWQPWCCTQMCGTSFVLAMQLSIQTCEAQRNNTVRHTTCIYIYIYTSRNGTEIRKKLTSTSQQPTLLLKKMSAVIVRNLVVPDQVPPICTQEIHRGH